jgi:tRNA(Met) cytidine acetyltransferase
MDYHSVGNCLRAVGEALVPLVDHYGGEVAAGERERFG